MNDDQVIALMVCLFRIRERLDREDPQPLIVHIMNGREILRLVRESKRL